MTTATPSDRLAAFNSDIAEEPATLDRIRQEYSAGGGPLRELPQQIPGPVVFVGMGSSYNACQAALWWLRRGGLAAWSEYASEATAGQRPVGTTLVAVSQSGRTTETLRAIAAFREAGGQRVVGVTNVDSSELANSADIVLPLLAGPEGGISAKSYVASVAVLTLLAGHLLQSNRLGVSAIESAIRVSEDVLATWPQQTERVVSLLSDAGVIQVVGSGAGLASALEGALILKEAPEVPAEGAVTADFLHGAFHLIDDSFVGILLTDSPAGWRDEELRAKVLGGGGRLLAIGGDGNATCIFPLPEVAAAARPMVEITPIELAAAAMWADRIGS